MNTNLAPTLLCTINTNTIEGAFLKTDPELADITRMMKEPTNQ